MLATPGGVCRAGCSEYLARPLRLSDRCGACAGVPAICWTAASGQAKIFDGTRAHVAALVPEEHMLAVIGNLLAGLGVLGLFAATLRLSKPARRS